MKAYKDKEGKPKEWWAMNREWWNIKHINLNNNENTNINNQGFKNKKPRSW